MFQGTALQNKFHFGMQPSLNLLFQMDALCQLLLEWFSKH